MNKKQEKQRVAVTAKRSEVVSAFAQRLFTRCPVPWSKQSEGHTKNAMSVEIETRLNSTRVTSGCPCDHGTRPMCIARTHGRLRSAQPQNSAVRATLKRFLVLAALITGVTMLGVSPVQDGEYDTNAAQNPPGNVRFTTVDIIINTHGSNLAAWQIEFDAPQSVTIVGIQNGDFSVEAPHYDPAAIQNNRVILAQYSLDNESGLLAGEIRVTTLHLRVEGELDLNELEIELTAAGDERGERIVNASVRLEKSND